MTWYGNWNLVTTMSSLCTALDLVQNGGITSGIDMFLDVFWTLHDAAKVFGAMTFMDKNFNVCLRNTLAACFAFASEFETFLVQLRFPGCA